MGDPLHDRLHNAARRLADDLMAGAFGGCPDYARDSLHHLSLFLAASGDEAATLAESSRPRSERERGSVSILPFVRPVRAYPRPDETPPRAA